jgi:hypothetical protein
MEGEKMEPEEKAEKKKIGFITYRHLGHHDMVKDSQGHYMLKEKTGEEVLQTPRYEIHVWQSTDLANLYGRFSSAAAFDDAHRRTRDWLVRQIFADMKHKVKEFDHSYIYVGNKRGLEMAWLAHGLPEASVTYVMCDCKIEQKMRIIANNGHNNPDIKWCDCEDSRTLEGLLNKFL